MVNFYELWDRYTQTLRQQFETNTRLEILYSKLHSLTNNYWDWKKYNIKFELYFAILAAALQEQYKFENTWTSPTYIENNKHQIILYYQNNLPYSDKDREIDNFLSFYKTPEYQKEDYNLIRYYALKVKPYSFTSIEGIKPDKQNLIYFGYGTFYCIETDNLFVSRDLIKELATKENIDNREPFIISILTNNPPEPLKDFIKNIYQDNIWKHRDWHVSQTNLKLDYNALANELYPDIIPQNLLDDLMLNEALASIQRALTEQVETYKQRIDDIQNKYKEALKRLENAQLQTLNIKENFLNKLKDIKNYLEFEKNITKRITKYNIEPRDCSNGLKIEVVTNFLPITFIDKNILKTYLRNNRNKYSTEKNELLDKVCEDELDLIATPLTVKIYFDYMTNDVQSEYRDKAYWLANNGRLPFYNNGHIEYSCLGTFRMEITKAAAEFDLKRVISLYLQYCQSLAPADVAGQKGIETCMIANHEGKILYADGRNDFINLNINNYDPISRTFKKGEENATNS